MNRPVYLSRPEHRYVAAFVESLVYVSQMKADNPRGIGVIVDAVMLRRSLSVQYGLTGTSGMTPVAA